MRLQKRRYSRFDRPYIRYPFMQIASTTAESQLQSIPGIIQIVLAMSRSSTHLPERSNSSQSIPLLPAKAYVPPSSEQASTQANNPLIHAHVGDDAMPTENEIKDATTKRTSSSASTASSFASSTDADNPSFLPLADSKE